MAKHWLIDNSRGFTVGTIVGSISLSSCACLAYNQFRKSYPEFTPLPGPIKQIGVSYHRIPNQTRFKIFYPTSALNIELSNSKPPDTYFTDPQTITTLHNRLGIPKFIINAMNDLRYSKHPIAYYLNAPISPPPDASIKYPLLVFSHGNFASFDVYTELCCGLSSYGMIVAIADHTDCSALYTKLANGSELFYEGKRLIDSETGTKYQPSPWTREHDVADFGEQRLKPIRVPEFKALYEYLKSDETEDESLRVILENVDFENVVFGGQSFGGVTSWMASRDYQDEGNLKCLLLLDPWFGCLDKSELEEMKWSLPAYAMSSEVWIKEKPYATSCTRIVMENGDNDASVWEYGKGFRHYDSADIPIWGPSFVTQCRKGYTAQEWNDLLLKRSMSFVVEHIPKMKEWINEEQLKYDRFKLVNLMTREVTEVSLSSATPKDLKNILNTQQLPQNTAAMELSLETKTVMDTELQ